jgi:hypothetical protein
MKKLLLLLALFAISCEKKSEPYPVKVISEDLIFSDSLYSFYRFTLRNESDAIVDSFKVTVSLYEDGLQIVETRKYRDELVPYEEAIIAIVFEYAIKNDSNVTFKYRFE